MFPSLSGSSDWCGSDCWLLKWLLMHWLIWLKLGFSSSHRWPPPALLLSDTNTHAHTQTQRWFLQDLTITRGAFNQSGMQLGGASDGSGGGKEVITPSQSLSLILDLFLSLPPSLRLCRFLTSAFLRGPSPVISARLYLNNPFSSLPSLSSPVFLPSLLVLHVWLLADMHTGSIAHLPNFSSSCLAPSPLLLLLTSFSCSMYNY